MSRPRGPGLGHIRKAPAWPPSFCARCGQIISDEEALRVAGRWEHAARADGSRLCPRPGIDGYEEDAQTGRDQDGESEEAAWTG